MGRARLVMPAQITAGRRQHRRGRPRNTCQRRERSRIPTPKGVGVLVKAPKPGQDRRIDMPAIGPKTVEAAARAGLAGVAVVAGSTIVAEPLAVVRAADAAGLFVYGIEPPQ